MANEVLRESGRWVEGSGADEVGRSSLALCRAGAVWTATLRGRSDKTRVPPAVERASSERGEANSQVLRDPLLRLPRQLAASCSCCLASPAVLHRHSAATTAARPDSSHPLPSTSEAAGGRPRAGALALGVQHIKESTAAMVPARDQLAGSSFRRWQPSWTSFNAPEETPVRSSAAASCPPAAEPPVSRGLLSDVLRAR